MSHSCASSLCESPHFDNDDHKDGCLCDICHSEHDFEKWFVYPECDGCEDQLMTWLAENTDYLELQRQHGRAA